MKNQIKIKNILLSIAPAILTLAIFMGVLLAKGIFPFGAGRIDYYDMGQTNAPLYYHIWDVLHGKSSLFYSWYINEGQNLSMGSAIQWNISPFNLFFVIIPRNMVMKSLSVFMGLHLAGMALAMYVFLTGMKKEAPYHARFIASVAYGLCGYTLTHYTIPTYLDTSVFLPVLALGFYKLMKDGKPWLYTIMLGFTTALSYYLGFMHLIYILLFSGVWMFILLSGKENAEIRRDRIWKIAAGTVGGLAISSVMLIPAVLQMTMSSRFNSNLSGGPVDTLVSILNSVGADEYYVKGWQIYGMECAMAVILFGAIHFRKDIKRTITVLLMVFIPCALIPFESINILWHFGTYYHYPIRCAYLIPFAILTGAAYFAGEFTREDQGEKSDNSLKKLIPGVIASGAAVIFAGAVLTYFFKHDIWTVQELYRFWKIFAAGLFVIFFACMLVRYRKITVFRSIFFRKTALYLMILLPLSEFVIGAAIGYGGNPHFTDTFFADPEQSGEYVVTAIELDEKLQLTHEVETDRIQRLKNPDTDLNTNYGMVMGRATVTGWANTVTGTQQKSAEKLGYSTHFMRILDAGGTFFTDSLLGVTEYITRVPFAATSFVTEKIGEAETSNGKYELYKNNAAFPSVIAINGNNLESFDPSDMYLADAQNELYQAVSGSNDTIITRFDDENGKSERKILIEGRKALYMRGGQADAVQVNGENIPVPTIGDIDNTAYPAWFNTSLIYLGSYEDREVVVKCPEKSYIFILDLDKLQSLGDKLQAEEAGVKVGKSTLTATIRGSEEKNMAILPVHCDPGFSANVNGKKAEITDIAGILTGVPIENGENEIVLTFCPKGLIPGSIITALALLAVILLMIAEKRGLTINTACERLAQGAVGRSIEVLYTLAFGAFTAVFYVIPIGWFMIHEVLKRVL